jgi:hypothetical protein
LECNDGKSIHDQWEILQETKTFHELLYILKKTHNLDTTIDLHNEIGNEDVPKLSNIESASVEGIITIEEASKTLFKISPTNPQDRMFWKHTGHFVITSINHGYKSNCLSVTQRHGIITLLPKGDKPKHYLKNWRPITLLNSVLSSLFNFPD